MAWKTSLKASLKLLDFLACVSVKNLSQSRACPAKAPARRGFCYFFTGKK